MAIERNAIFFRSIQFSDLILLNMLRKFNGTKKPELISVNFFEARSMLVQKRLSICSVTANDEFEERVNEDWPSELVQFELGVVNNALSKFVKCFTL